jgi:hypothetical protein
VNTPIFLNEKTSIDLPTLLDTRLLIQANSGGGKSWLIRRILEQSHGNVQHIIIDSEGEFSTLREQYDYVLAGKDGDTPADPKSAALLARKLLELNVSAILDLYELHADERKRFVRLFLDSMINAPKDLWHPCLVVIDEAHKFCPEKEQSEASSAVIDLATLGRKRGYCAILATQRLSKLHKDAAAECNNKLIGRTNLDVDMKRASEELGFTSKDSTLALRHLKAGQFFTFGPAISQEVIQVDIGQVKTTHPKAGSRIATAAPIPPSAKIRTILGALKDLPQEAEQEAQTIAALQRKVAELQRQLAQKNHGPGKQGPSKEIDTAVKTALQRQQQTFTQEKQRLEARIQQLQTVLQSASETLATVLKEPVAAAVPAKQPDLPTPLPAQQETSSHLIQQPPVRSDGITRILQVLASRYPMKFTRSQLATLAHLSPRSGTYSKYLTQLKTQEYITLDNGHILLTEQGKQYAEPYTNQATDTENPIALWQRTISGGARRIFDALIQTYPNTITKDDIGKQTGLSPRSGTFNKYMSTLRRNGLIEIQGQQIKAAKTLFL